MYQSTNQSEQSKKGKAKDKKAAAAKVQLKSAHPEHQKEEKIAENIQRKENKTGMPDQLKSGIENLSGYSMDDVKVHYNSSKPSQLNAHAYAQGNQIHLASGQEKHLPHEAWHVVQQKQGRVQPTMNVNGASINDDAGLETEADVMGQKAVQLKGFDNVYVASVNKHGVKQLAVAVPSMDKDQPFQLVQLPNANPNKESWGDWFWKHKWKFAMAAGVGGAILLARRLYFANQGANMAKQMLTETTQPPAPSGFNTIDRAVLSKELMSDIFSSNNKIARAVFKTMNGAMWVENQPLGAEHYKVLHETLITNEGGIRDALVKENAIVMATTGYTPIYLLGKYLVHYPLQYYLNYQK